MKNLSYPYEEPNYPFMLGICEGLLLSLQAQLEGLVDRRVATKEDGEALQDELGRILGRVAEFMRRRGLAA